MFKMCKITQNTFILLCSCDFIADFEKCQLFPAGICLFKTASTIRTLEQRHKNYVKSENGRKITVRHYIKLGRNSSLVINKRNRKRRCEPFKNKMRVK